MLPSLHLLKTPRGTDGPASKMMAGILNFANNLKPLEGESRADAVKRELNQNSGVEEEDNRPFEPDLNEDNCGPDDDHEIKLFVMNFDGVLTRLAQHSDNRISPLSKMRVFDIMKKDQFVALFGGAAELKLMDNIFSWCRDMDIELRILTGGPTAQVTLALQQVGLLQYFMAKDGTSRVFGGDILPLSKAGAFQAQVVQRWMNEEKLCTDEVLYLASDGDYVTSNQDGDGNVIVDTYGDQEGIDTVLEKNHYLQHPDGEEFSKSAQFVKEVLGYEETRAEVEKPKKKPRPITPGNNARKKRAKTDAALLANTLAMMKVGL